MAWELWSPVDPPQNFACLGTNWRCSRKLERLKCSFDFSSVQPPRGYIVIRGRFYGNSRVSFFPHGGLLRDLSLVMMMIGTY